MRKLFRRLEGRPRRRWRKRRKWQKNARLRNWRKFASVFDENDEINTKARWQVPAKATKATKMTKKLLDWEIDKNFNPVAIFRYFWNGGEFKVILVTFVGTILNLVNKFRHLRQPFCDHFPSFYHACSNFLQFRDFSYFSSTRSIPDISDSSKMVAQQAI